MRTTKFLVATLAAALFVLASVMTVVARPDCDKPGVHHKHGHHHHMKMIKLMKGAKIEVVTLPNGVEISFSHSDAKKLEMLKKKMKKLADRKAGKFECPCENGDCPCAAGKGTKGKGPCDCGMGGPDKKHGCGCKGKDCPLRLGKLVRDEAIEFKTVERADGVTVRITSTDAQKVKMIQEHAAFMKKKVEWLNSAPVPPEGMAPPEGAAPPEKVK